jgi:DNA-binding NarL/FixJ family response regulator
MTYSIALVDDHHLIRAGVAGMVNALGGYRVSVEAGNGRELVNMLQAQVDSGTGWPDIAIVDLNMPVMDGYETLNWLRKNAPKVRPLVLTFDAADDAMVKAVHAGARGFILKNARPDQLKNALDALMMTGYYYTDQVHAAILREPDKQLRHEREREELLAQITPRELDFLRFVCSEQEFTYDQIAESMGVHRRTVDHFRQGLFEKLHIKSKTGLVLFAMRYGIVH